jgi:hypothetical protein
VFQQRAFDDGGNEAMESSKWKLACRQNVNMAARCVECILLVRNLKHGDDVNSEVTIDKFILYSNTICIFL